MATGNQTIRDLSSSINVTPTQAQNANTIVPTGTPNANPGASTSGSSNIVAPAVHNLVVEETLNVQRVLDEKLKAMVQTEMSDIRRSLGELTNIVKEMSSNSIRLPASTNSQQSLNQDGANSWNRIMRINENRLTAPNRSSVEVQPNNDLGAASIDPLSDSRFTPGIRSIEIQKKLMFMWINGVLFLMEIILI